MRKLICAGILCATASTAGAGELGEFEKAVIGIALGAAIIDTFQNPDRPINNYYAPAPLIQVGPSRVEYLRRYQPRCTIVQRQDYWTGLWETVRVCR